MSYYLDQVSPSPSPLSNQTLSTEPILLSKDESGARTVSHVVVVLGILIVTASLFIAYYVYKERRNVEIFESISTASKEITDAFEMTSFEQAEIANNRKHKKKKQKKRIRFNRQKRRNSTKPLPLLKEEEEVELHFSSSRQDGITTIREEDEELDII